MASEGKLVMTSFDCGECLIIRMERVDASQIDDNAVFYAARGPFQGIFLSNPGATYVAPTTGPAAEVTLEATLEDVKVKQMGEQGESFQEHRTIRFWFDERCPDDASRQGNIQVFLSDLLQPQDFPKDYSNFIKKMLVLMKRYPLFVKTEMALSYPEGGGDGTEGATGGTEDGGETTLSSQRYITLTTPANGNHYYVRELATQGKSFVSFTVKAPADAHVALSEFFGDPDSNTFEVVLGGDSNSTSYITESTTGQQYELTATPEILSEHEARPFWISWAGNRMEVGRGTEYGKERIMAWNVPEGYRHNVNHMGVSTGEEGPGTWEFIELADVTVPDEELAPDVATSQVKTAGEVRVASKGVSLILMAKKARMVESLEHAYPNSLTTDDLMRMHQIKPSDRLAMKKLLDELRDKEVIREVEDNRWIRNMQAEHEDKHDTVELSRLHDMGGKPPTVGIVTTLFCEKLAVDAMMDRKTTYVKYQTQGESTVYTVGRIGPHSVVVTKLPRIGAGRAAQISAGNTMTRLIGTFSKIEHVLLVGVGGGVPDLLNYDQHVRRGDVVVSFPSDDSGAIYLNCDRAEKTESRDRSFLTRSWGPHDPGLLRAAQRVFAKPDWLRFMAEGKEVLTAATLPFHRPPTRLDRLFVIDDSRPEGDKLVEVEPPAPSSNTLEAPDASRLRAGPIGSGRYLTKELIRIREFAAVNKVKAYDGDFSAVMESLAGNRMDSYLLLRGVADYMDGSKGLEWQPHAALAAAAVAKALVMELSPPDLPSPADYH